ncbi:MAG: hypothetical protein COA78_15820 [Blastopirellula sp.]|nr:MAG: hypothetical protein COA78_15820 [Blastopirellula sp.]
MQIGENLPWGNGGRFSLEEKTASPTGNGSRIVVCFFLCPAAGNVLFKIADIKPQKHKNQLPHHYGLVRISEAKMYHSIRVDTTKRRLGGEEQERMTE